MSKVILPSWEDCEKAVDRGNPSVLERFIYDNEPAIMDGDYDWREALRKLLWYAKYGSIVKVKHD